MPYWLIIIVDNNYMHIYQGEVCQSGSLLGYRSMWNRIVAEYGVVVPRYIDVYSHSIVLE